jgi:hypothetical protein
VPYAVISVNDESSSKSKAALQPLLKESDFRALLGGMSERKFKQLRAAGVIGEPLELGPRVARWTHEDYEFTVRHLPRRAKAPEPETLATGRRARIDAVKAGAAQ